MTLGLAIYTAIKNHKTKGPIPKIINAKGIDQPQLGPLKTEVVHQKISWAAPHLVKNSNR